MKKIIFILSFVFLMFITPAMADILNEDDIDIAVNKLDVLSNFDPYSIFNKSEVIGTRRDQFEMSTNQYKTGVIAAKDRINKDKQELFVFKDDQEMPEDQKTVQIGRIYQDVNFTLSQVEMNTYNYVNNLRWFMPTLTYQRYYKGFLDYYQNLDIRNYKQ